MNGAPACCAQHPAPYTAACADEGRGEGGREAGAYFTDAAGELQEQSAAGAYPQLYMI